MNHKPNGIYTFSSCGKMRKIANSVNDEVASFDSAFEEALKCLSQFNMSSALKLEQKEASTLVLESIYWLRCQMALGKA